jgi:hypothetical protein
MGAAKLLEVRESSKTRLLPRRPHFFITAIFLVAFPNWDSKILMGNVG